MGDRGNFVAGLYFKGSTILSELVTLEIDNM